MRTTRAMLMNFCSILLVLADFACEKVNGNIVKRQKTSALKQFSLPRYFKKRTA